MAACREQGLVCPLLDDAAAVEHDEPVHAADCRQPMRDGDDRAPFHQFGELFLDRRLDLGIERRCRLVEDQDRRVLQDHPGERDALPLAARQFDAALADMRIERGAPVPIFEPFDEFERVGPARRVNDLGLARLGPAVADIVADRAMQQRGVLRDHADLRAQALLRQSGDVAPVDQDATAFRPVKPEQQMHECRFAGARAPNEPNPLARRDVELQFSQHAAAARHAAVIEADPLEADPAGDPRQLD